MIVRSAFDLAPEQQALTEGAIKETLGAQTQVRFETAPELISGIELIANGQKVAWSIADHLTSLEKNVDVLMKAADKPAAKVEPKAEAKHP